MTNPELYPILDRCFRANPAYRAVVFDRLPSRIRESLQGLRDAANLYGVLEPRTSEGTYKAISRDIALLFLTLREPGPLPSYVGGLFAENANSQIARLVFDGALEIEHEGRFISGAAAHAVLCSNPSESIDERGHLQSLSLAALRYAQALEIDEVTTLSARLYFYNRLPVTPAWRKLLRSREDTLAFLRLDHGPPRNLLDREWRLSKAVDAGWIQWSTVHRDRRPERSTDTGTFKLYLSPMLDHLAEVIEPVIEAFTVHRAWAFKIGVDAHNLLRPDKVIAYFKSFAELESCACQLTRQLGSVPAHGVPFTAELTTVKSTDDGLLSWGLDPPPSEHLIEWQERESWRLWLTNRLANAILVARRKPELGVEPLYFALERLRLEGIDTATWAPQEALWKATPEGT